MALSVMVIPSSGASPRGQDLQDLGNGPRDLGVKSSSLMRDLSAPPQTRHRTHNEPAVPSRAPP